MFTFVLHVGETLTPIMEERFVFEIVGGFEEKGDLRVEVEGA